MSKRKSIVEKLTREQTGPNVLFKFEVTVNIGYEEHEQNFLQDSGLIKQKIHGALKTFKERNVTLKSIESSED